MMVENMKFSLIVLLCLTLGLTSRVQAQSEVQLEEILVGATRTQKTAEEAPASVTIISREDMERINASTVDDVLRYETGVIVKRSKGIADTTMRIQLRGLYGQDRTLVLLDGLPLNDGYVGSVPWNQIGVENIERIEIIRGPGSALYGGHAMGGVINIITRRPQGLEARIRGGLGSDDTKRLSLSAGQLFWDKLGVRLGYEHEELGGYPTITVRRPLSAANGTETLTGGYPTTTTTGTPQWVVGDMGDNWAERRNLNLQTSLDLADGSLTTLDAQWGRHKYGYDAPHTFLRDADGNSSFSGAGSTADGRRLTVTPSNYIFFSGKGEETFIGSALGHERQFGAILVSAKLGYQDTDKWYTINRATGAQTYFDAPGELVASDTRSVHADLQGTLPLGDHHTLTTGATFAHNRFDQESFRLAYYRDEKSKLNKTEITEGKDRFFGVFVQDEWRLPADLTLFLGARFDYWKAYDGRSGAIGNEQNFSEPSDTAFSPKASLVWNPLVDTFVRTSAGQAFRPPTIYELYRTWQSGTLTYQSNPDLDPETLWNYEVGFDQFFLERRLKFGATVFHSRLKDAIERVAADDDPNQRVLQNVGKARINGLELETEVRPLDWLRLWGNAAWFDSKVKENDKDPASVGNHLTLVPLSVYNAGAEGRWRWVRVSLDGNYQGRVYTRSDNTDIADVYGGYSKGWLWNGKLAVLPTNHLEFALSVNNIFDESHFVSNVGRERNYLFEAAARW